ncbi:unannotated protein [freshwater metagenome]|uniref:Unannotated protein n=1 Tax=freshwater metagenome TaxID=449393 RepID=A0A6J7IUH8_9ZZZZ|nr:sigma-70 family RNA polymerase sigma factor [Actinomycetota bacterium]
MAGGPSPFLRLQSDEKLVALTREGNQSAYEVLVSRYDARLIAFTRHMLGSREDAEDVVQETFAAAYSAMVADERPINVKPWLYRIARNRSLNHMRRQSAIGVDDFDLHMADHGRTTADEANQREEFRVLMADIRELPETQRTALLLREIDALSYDQIAEAMDTTVPSVKSLLVRARVSLGEAAEARRLTCDEVRIELGEVAEGLTRLSPAARRHMRDCGRCSAFRATLKANNKALALMLPIGPLLLLKKLILAHLGATASAGAGTAATAGTAAAGSAVAGTAAGSAAGGAISAGISAVASKAVATVAAAAIVTAGAVEVNHATTTTLARTPAAAVIAASSPPNVVKRAAPPTSVVVAAAPAPTATALQAPPAASAPAPAPAPTADVTPAPAPAPVDTPTQEQVDDTTLPSAGYGTSDAVTPPTVTPTEPAQPTDGTAAPTPEITPPPAPAPAPAPDAPPAPPVTTP